MAVIRRLVIWLIVIPVIHGLVPWALSIRRYGWSEGSPAVWKWISLIPVAFAIALLRWIQHWKSRSASGPDSNGDLAIGTVDPPIDPTPAFLMVRGPYRFTRNPVYVAYLGLWFGWAFFWKHRCPAWMVGIVSGFASLTIVPKEERDLQATFGEIYLQSKFSSSGSTWRIRDPTRLGFPKLQKASKSVKTPRTA